MSAPRRNVELKASDPDPERTLALALALGARDEGLLRQRDTYFRVPAGRLKLREEEPGRQARLVQYERPDGGRARESRYRLVAVPDPAQLRAALDASLGTLAVVEKERRLLLHGCVRIHLDRVASLGTFLELEGVATPGSDLADEEAQVAAVAAALEIEAARILGDSYADQVLGAAALVRAAREVMARAYAPYSGLRVGAALRADDGSVHVGANVENAAYPQGQCAEASAIGALVTAGRTRITDVAVAAEDGAACPPCGGCRQRLSELATSDARVHLATTPTGSGDADGVAAAAPFQTLTLAALLPHAFGPQRLPR